MAAEFPYQSRHVEVVPELAGVVLDAVAGDHAAGPSGRWVVEAPAGRVEFEGVPVVLPAAAAAYRPVRRVAGRLVSAGRSTPVELELLPWSQHASELALRFAGGGLRRRPFTALMGDGYVKLGDDVLRILAAAMERWPSGFLGGLVEDVEELKAS